MEEKQIGQSNSNKKIRPQGIKSWLNHRVLRRLIQTGSAVFILFLVVQNYILGEGSGANTVSPEAFCPFGGLETLYKWINSGGALISHTHLSNLVLLAAVLITALLFRSAFCGWICPLGFIQDLIASLRKGLQRRWPAFRRWMASVRKFAAPLAILDRYLRLVKYLVLAWSVIGAAVYGYMVFRDFDPWSALINIATWTFTPGLVVLAVTLIASFFVERPWCRYACPLGAASGLVGKLSPVYLKREESACTSCKICTRACPMGLPVHTATTIKSLDCNSCLECVDQCPVNGALEVKIGLPLFGK